MSIFKVRPATQRDAAAVAEVHVAAWQTAYADLMPADDLAKISLDKRKAVWREAIEYSEPQVLVCMMDDKLVGFAGFDRSRDPKTSATTGEIWALYVLPSYWDKGAGLALWDATEEACEEEGFDKLTLWVFLGNERGLRFFEMAGFKRDMKTLRTTPVGSVKLEEIRLQRALG